ncbi:ParB family chromosome partitioning protein [Agrobacterium larrymoorei]|uniref:ParB family chromosome partitioning protein n=1 Tax=Agrobacterium larrymoorei TaxID=160699 RepID=A0AAJ2EUS7_9HYPH|nr:plasmid partitioning protein RepB [Agrobacterium larrymoorei]MDR6101757.1 ParB family chromosome partitioning protein [Agrobacterium larrymoorei]
MSKASGKKSILASFASYTPPQQKGDEAPAEDVAPSASRVAGVIGATQRTLAELREERDQLKALAEAGGEIEIDPELVDPSPFPDRLKDDSEANFEAFKASIASEGQLIPILVRRHPTVAGRYQVGYGHRRLRAARELGRNVKAKVGELDDRQIALAQGMENSGRQDLSWAEKALFASGMAAAGIKARDIRAALSVDDAELARFRAVCRSVSEDVIRAIGRAPKAGRKRWVALAQACEDSAGMSRVRETLARAKVSDSDARFVAALNAATAKTRPASQSVEVADRQGRKVGTASFKPGEIRILVNQALAPDFAVFLQEELPEIVERYQAKRNQ